MKAASPVELDRARDRLAAVGSIASLVVHRGRNRLATLRAALELLAEGLEANLSAEYRNTLLRELDDFIGEFNFAADLIRTETGPPGEVSVQELIEEAAAAFGPHAALACQYGHRRDRIFVDRRLLRLALLNLLRHAADARPGRPAAQLGLRTSEVGDGLEIAVSASRPVALRAGDAESSGLAWSLCRDAMLLLGGSVEAGAPAEPGSFRLRLG